MEEHRQLELIRDIVGGCGARLRLVATCLELFDLRRAAAHRADASYPACIDGVNQRHVGDHRPLMAVWFMVTSSQAHRLNHHRRPPLHSRAPALNERHVGGESKGRSRGELATAGLLLDRPAVANVPSRGLGGGGPLGTLLSLLEGPRRQ